MKYRNSNYSSLDEKESIERVKERIESLQETEKHYSCVINMAAEKKKTIED